jgi:glycosyltransferase domain-containing protein
MLTVLLPTRNRAPYCAAQLRFFEKCELAYPIIVADSSDPAHVSRVMAGCTKNASYRRFDPHLLMADKLLAAVQSVNTAYVVVVPDDDVTFPHAIERSLSFLQQHDEYVAAHGYVLDFRIEGDAFDMFRVFGFTPTIGEPDPLQRMYHLARRYQPFYYAVMRTEVFVEALRAAVAMRLIVFRELTVMHSIVLRGCVARLPIIYNLRGSEPSLTTTRQNHPFFAFLEDAEDFFSNYAKYRNGLTRFIREKVATTLDKTRLEQVLDVIHATHFAREIDTGMLNHAAQLMLRDDPGSTLLAPPAPATSPPGADIIHRSRSADRLYIWREQVIKAEPHDEILISPEEIDRAEQQLDRYELDVWSDLPPVG